MSAAGGAQAQRLRTVLCTRGGLYGALVLRRLRSCERLEVCAIVRSQRIVRPEYGWMRGALALIRRCGIAYSLYLWCATSLMDLLCRFAPGGAVPSGTRGIPLYTTTDVNDRRGLEFLTRCAPQLLVSAYFDQRLHAALLAVPELGCVNIHPSILPTFRGVDPVLQACIDPAAAQGVTVHWMSPELDVGAILMQRCVPVPARQSVFATTATLFRAGAELLVEALDGICSREPGKEQGAGTYQGWPTRADVRALHERGGVLIRWSDLLAFGSHGQ